MDANRDYIKHVIEVTLFLGRQGISFQGHKEDKGALNKGISSIIISMGTYIDYYNLTLKKCVILHKK